MEKAVSLFDMEPLSDQNVIGLLARNLHQSTFRHSAFINSSLPPAEYNHLQIDQGGHTSSNANQSQPGRQDDGNEHQPLLACPFYKSDRGKYQDCLRLQLKRIKDVKQHISRKHIQAPFCAICGLEFDTQEQQAVHCRLQQCQIRDFPTPDGITYSQRDSISTRARRNQGLSSQWFAVWDLLFPSKPRPASAFIEHPVREAMDSLREIWSREGLNIISATFQRYREQSPSRIYDEYLPAAVSDAMSALFDQFLKKNPSATSQTQVGTISRGQELALSGWDRMQGSRTVNHEGQAESFTSPFLSTSPGLMDFGTLSKSDNTCVLKDSELDEPLVELGAWGDFLAEGCNLWTGFSAPPEHQGVR